MISAERIAAIRAQNELVAFIEAAGVKLTRRGASYIGLCPFHADKTPSLAVSPKKQYWCCHGACSSAGKKVGGDVIEFAQRLWRVDFREAVARLGGATLDERPQIPTKRAAPRIDLLAQVARVYHQTLASSAEAKQYLVSRGITSADAIAALEIGYADGSLIERAPEGSETRAHLEALGVISTKGRELMHGCLVVPLRDANGNVVNLYGRAIDRDGHYFLPGPRRGLVNANVAATSEELVICESVIDALSFIEAGVMNVVPIYGVNGWTSDHDALLETHRIRRVVVALDSDAPGQNAAAALAHNLESKGIVVRNVVLPAKDANDLLVREGRERFAAIWRELLHGSEKQRKEEPPAMRIERDGEDHVVRFTDRTYRVRGLTQSGVGRMRVTLRVEQNGRFYVDTFDLYSARGRRGFTEATAQTFELQHDTHAAIAGELANLIDALERERLAMRATAATSEPEKMTAHDRDDALAMLRDPNLLARLREDFAAIGCVGEESSMLAGYLATLSRKLPEPMSVLFCARSGAGKSTMQDRLCELVPPDDLIKYTRITGQALFYKEPNALMHKLLAIDEEEGAAEAAYSLRNLQSGGYLSVSATRTDPQSGKQRAEDYRVNGPTSIFLTTAHPEALDYETRNRFVMLTVDESKEQTRRILERQRWSETLEGLIAREKREAIIRRHRDAQRLLEPLRIVIPESLGLSFPTGRLILRREHKKYLALIKAIALLHQQQRERKRAAVGDRTVEYIEATRSDVELAQTLATSLLRRNLDELAPPTRSLARDIAHLVAAKRDAVFDRKELQTATGLSLWHIRTYLAQLIEYEYIAPVAGGGRRGKRNLYELLWDGEEDEIAIA
ncbi:MAG TPA: CHC2 zinc finger domain-containing protein [Thermoanaerobaculia bacterium]